MIEKTKITQIQKSRGFTLIELLVVIAIIGLLSSVVLTSLNSARIKAKSSVFKTEIINLRPLVISLCSEKDFTNVTVPADFPLVGAHPAASWISDNCGPNGDGSFLIRFGAATNGGACTGADVNQFSVTFTGC